MSKFLDLDEYVEETKEKVSVLPDVDRESINNLLNSLLYLSEEEQRQTVQMIDEITNNAFTEHKLNSKNPIMIFPTYDESFDDGFLQIGYVMAGDIPKYSFCLSKTNVTENILVVGRAGQGKTTLIFNFVKRLVERNINWIFFDVKDDYSGLCKMYDDVFVLSWNALKLNIWTNVPPGMPRKLWYRVVLDVLSHSQGLYSATPNHIIEQLEELHEEKKGHITNRDVVELLKSKYESSNKRDEYSSVAFNRLNAINETFDEVINVPFGWDVSKLFKGRVVIRTFPLTFENSSFLIQVLLLWEFYRRLFAQERLNRKFTYENGLNDFLTIVILDEAHHVMYSGQQESSVSIEKSIPPMSTIGSMGREFGLSILGSTQMSQHLLGTFKDNAGTLIVGNIPDFDQRWNLGASLGMDRDESKILGKVKKGTWVCKVLGRTDPFLLQTPLVSKGDMVAEKEILATAKPFILKLDAERKDMESRMFLSHLDKKQKTKLPEIGKEAWNVLNHLLEHPWQYQKQIMRSLGLSSEKMNDAKRQLKSRGLIEMVKFKVDREELHFILTKKALFLLKSFGKNPSRVAFWGLFNSMPSYQHRYMQFLTYIRLKDLGYVAKSEFKITDDRRVDVYAEGQKRIAVEIEHSTSDIENKVSILKDGLVDELVLLYTDEGHLEKIKSKLESMDVPSDKIWIGMANEYVKILRDMKDTVSGPESSRNEQNQNNSLRDKENFQNRGRNEGENA